MTGMRSAVASERASAPRRLYTCCNPTRLPGRQSADQEWRAFLLGIRLGTQSVAGGARQQPEQQADRSSTGHKAKHTRSQTSPSGQRTHPLEPESGLTDPSMSHPLCKIPNCSMNDLVSSERTRCLS